MKALLWLESVTNKDLYASLLRPLGIFSASCPAVLVFFQDYGVPLSTLNPLNRFSFFQ